MRESQNKWQFWVDRGGTFTDVIALNPNGKLICHKLLSQNPAKYRDPIIQGMRDILKISRGPIPSEMIAAVKIGTTVATNALLERKGESVLLAITEGFGDALRIGYQNRPELFNLNIQLQPPLYKEVIEIQERIDAHGNILTSLDEKSVLQLMKQKYAQGFRTIAIVLMHGYRFPQHEKCLANLANSIGFTHISVSHDVAPLIKIISRGATAVVNAYLSPILEQYIRDLKTELGDVPVFFMQSNGGLVHASLFQGKDSIISGPAGGVIGMIKASENAGYHKVIGFDMGGTSTDVSHFNGELERTYTSDVGGVILHTPSLLIKTIAAGGGSILHFDGQRLSVGPDSAGADPGPACYRRGGPLTVTDCNVMVGKIQKDFFPKIFGEEGNQALDDEIVRTKFEILAKEIKKATGKEFSCEQLANNFLSIAVENMANAIKKISINRGYDISKYVLNCFGGAAGQHGCLVANALGMTKILVPTFTSVLSAYGIGVAQLRLVKQHTVEQNLNSKTLADIKPLQRNLEETIFRELTSQVVPTEKVRINPYLQIRYQDSDTIFDVPLDSEIAIKKNFEKKHLERFGFISEKKLLIVSSLTVEAIVQSDYQSPKTEDEIAVQKISVTPLKFSKVFIQNEFKEIPVFLRTDLQPGSEITEPAVIISEDSTIVVESGWKATITSNKDILLTLEHPLPKRKIPSTEADPMLLEVFNNRFMNISEQMGEVLRNTASSINIRERLDFSCAIFDSEGELIANAPHIPVHLGSMSVSVKSVLSSHKKTMKPKEIYALNSPYNGGTHLPDITIITPVFDTSGQKLLFLVGSRGHHADIGGITPGSIPATSKTISEEGVLINDLVIARKGIFLEEEILNALKNAPFPARNALKNIEDIKSQIAANERGLQELLKLTAEFGLDVVNAYMGHVRVNARRAIEKLLLRLEDGDFRYFLDDGSTIQVALRVDHFKKTAVIDFTGSAPLNEGNFNAPTAISQAAVLYVLRCLVAENIPLNSGCLEPIKFIIPQQSILNPIFPAAVVAGNVETSQCIVDTLLGAVKAVAASQGTCNNLTFGNEQFQYYETICGGAGAGPNFPGASAVHTHMTNTRITDPEVLENAFPVILEKFAIRRGSGGKGKFSGGDGVVRKIRFLQKMDVNIISSHRKIPPYGMEGGEPGKIGRNSIERKSGKIEKLGSSVQVEVYPGDVIIIETPGGGGFGKA